MYLWTKLASASQALKQELKKYFLKCKGRKETGTERTFSKSKVPKTGWLKGEVSWEKYKLVHL